MMRTALMEQMNITNQCFEECIQNLSSPDLSTSEKSCLQNCGSRLMTTMFILQDAQGKLQSRGGQF